MISKGTFFLSSSLIVLFSIFLLFLAWSPEKAGEWAGENRAYLTLISALLFAFVAVLISLRQKNASSYSFHLAKGEGTVSLTSLQKGIQRFFEKEDPSLQLVSCRLMEGGKHLELEVKETGPEKGKTHDSLLQLLSNLLAEQFGFEGQLDIFFKET